MSRNELEHGERINSILSRAFGVQGPPAPFMASELFPNLVMGNDRPEWGYLGNERYCAGQGSDAAAVGQTSHVGLNNPDASGVIAVVTGIVLANNTGAVATIDIAVGRDNTPDSSAGGHFRDTRYPSSQVSTCDIWLRTNATTQGTTIARYKIATGGTIVVTQPFVLSPGGFVVVRHSAQNVVCDASFYWREYAAAEGELRGSAGQ